jgi:hypothetical protein
MGYFSGAHCDKCESNIFWDENITKKWLNWRLRRRGWTVGKQILCPKCRNNRLKSTDKPNISP